MRLSEFKPIIFFVAEVRQVQILMFVVSYVVRL
jgi:hypothetical protein